MFRDLQCIQKAKVCLPAEQRGTAVYTDDYGGVWVVSDDAQEVYYYTAHTLASAMALQSTMLPSCVSSSSAEAIAAQPAHTLAFQCCSSQDASGEESSDRVHSVLFFTGDAEAQAAAAGGQHRRDACVITEGGTLGFLRVPLARDEPPTLLQPYQEVHLGLRVSAATATADAVVLCCFDGDFTEVVRTVVVPVGSAASVDAGACPHQSETVLSDALCTCEVEATGLFRVQGRIECVLYDEVHESLVAISDAGNVDVWDVANARDATAQYGSPAWDTAKHGTATCAVICREKLWIGLTSGQLCIFSLWRTDNGEARACTTASPSQSVLLLRSHGTPITGITSMSLQSSVWSCARDNGRVNVWDARDASFRGSFVFPESGIQSWYAGAAQLRTALWGLDGASGEPCLLQVSESISRPDTCACSSNADVRALCHQEELLCSYRLCMRALLRNICALRRGVQETPEDWTRDAVAAAALSSIDTDMRVVDDSMAVVRELQDTMASLRRLCMLASRERGGVDRPVCVVLDDCIAEWQQRTHIGREVESFLSFINAAIENTKSSGTVHSLADAQDAFERLQADVEALKAALAEAERSSTDDANAAAVEEATGALRQELAALQEALHAAEAEREELTIKLQVAEEEAESAAERHRHLEKLLEKTEAQLEEAKKSLLATKRAAEVTASEVSSLFDMESKLYESQQVIAELSTKIDVLVRDAETKKMELRAFHNKQETAKDVLRRVLCEQSTMADGVSNFADSLDQLIAEATQGVHAPLPRPLAELLNTILEKATTLETSMESRLREQKARFHALSSELKST